MQLRLSYCLCFFVFALLFFTANIVNARVYKDYQERSGPVVLKCDNFSIKVPKGYTGGYFIEDKVYFDSNKERLGLNNNLMHMKNGTSGTWTVPEAWVYVISIPKSDTHKLGRRLERMSLNYENATKAGGGAKIVTSEEKDFNNFLCVEYAIVKFFTWSVKDEDLPAKDEWDSNSIFGYELIPNSDDKYQTFIFIDPPNVISDSKGTLEPRKREAERIMSTLNPIKNKVQG